ncbi:SIR2 family protein [Bacillus anthracis]|uniref:SIR2 family NAD-dependent protein deacylase n=1 Tax=Bacillus cereus group TaxID=86661 RepID=UPI0022DFA2C1|nr:MULTISPECIES: SIR2 family protein [Bacillus cereus group]MDA1532086.1 SIR2 family protein [Bacillus cereus group sp. TH260-2LC]MDZ4486250.1 SIR2 family protein [Bacillus cereus]MEB9507844.1 SIR2 family protein [Bacillus anthracis]
MTRDVEGVFQEKLTMYPHLKAIRERLWMKDRKSRVSVMVGAGFSLNAKRVEATFEGMALWSDLKKRLIKDLIHHPDIEDKDVLEVSQIFVEEYGRTSLDEILKEAIPDDNYEPDKIHHDLLKLPWSDVYTTNYDTLLERAKKRVYERNYQVIYDINDIPSSVQPRIVKLHGSFPANRPFIFTKKDYENYPQNFRPFVNMVQQSIMETTFVLIGFSGDDPNFEKWTTWVQENLGDHMPKIYMIDCAGQNEEKLKELAEKGITLIDFKEIYGESENRYSTMFADIFEYLSYKNRQEKTKWPYKSYKNINNFKENRETYPNWVVMPTDIRKKYVSNIQEQITILLNSSKDIVNYLEEILWCCEKFYIPINFNNLSIKLEGLIDKLDESNEQYIQLLLLLLKEERLNFNNLGFVKYQELLDKFNLNKKQSHSLKHEQILYALNSDVQIVEKMMNQWDVEKTEIEWGIKKAIIYFRIHKNAKANQMLIEYLQTIRNLLAIKPDDYRLMSLESIVLHHLKNNGREDRLRFLNSKNCDAGKEYEQSVISVVKFENTYGKVRYDGFDPGVERIKTSYSILIDKALLNSFAVMQMQETLMLPTINNSELELAIRNLEKYYPTYCQIKKIQTIDSEGIIKLFSREFVYSMDQSNLDILTSYLTNSVFNKSRSGLDVSVEMEVISRIYFILPSGEKEIIDSSLIEFIKNKGTLKSEELRLINRFLIRIIVSKNIVESESFCKMLIQNNIFSLEHDDEVIMENVFFKYIIEGLEEQSKLCQFKMSQNQIEKLFNKLKDDNEHDVALLKIIALVRTDKLPQEFYNRLLTFIKEYSRRQSTRLQRVMEETVSLVQIPKLIDESQFILKEIPKFYKLGTFIGSKELGTYFRELYKVFSCTYKDTNEADLKNNIYKPWLEKFYLWWEDQKQGFNAIEVDNEYMFSENYFEILVYILGDRILGTIPKQLLDDRDLIKIRKIFLEIMEIRKDLSFYLIPSLERLGNNGEYGIDYLLDRLNDKKSNCANAAIQALHDCLLLNENKKINVEDPIRIKKEILHLIKYGSVDIVSMAINIVIEISKSIPTFFDESDYKVLIKYSNCYLTSIIEDVEFLTRDDLNLLTSYANLVTYICNNQSKIVGKQFNEWKKYIRNNHLPEVRVCADFLQHT